MKMLLILFFISTVSTVFAKTAPVKKVETKKAANSKKNGEQEKRAEILRQMHTILMEKFVKVVDKRKPVCDCIVRNFDKKLDTEDLALLLTDYKTADSKKSKAPPVDDDNEMLSMFNIDVSEACIKNPSWKLGDPE